MVDIRLNRDLERQLRRDPQTLPALQHAAEAAAAESQRLARHEAYDTGRYADGIEGQSGQDAGEMLGRVVGKDWKSALLEVGFTRQGRHYEGKAILRRGADAAGLHPGRTSL